MPRLTIAIVEDAVVLIDVPDYIAAAESVAFYCDYVIRSHAASSATSDPNAAAVAPSGLFYLRPSEPQQRGRRAPEDVQRDAGAWAARLGAGIVIVRASEVRP